MGAGRADRTELRSVNRDRYRRLRFRMCGRDMQAIVELPGREKPAANTYVQAHVFKRNGFAGHIHEKWFVHATFLGLSTEFVEVYR